MKSNWNFFTERLVRYAAPFRWELLGLAVLNIVMAGLGILGTVMTAAILFVLTGRYQQAGESIVGTMDFSNIWRIGLGDLAPTLFKTLGLSPDVNPFFLIVAFSSLNVGCVVLVSTLRYLAGLMGMRVGLEAGRHAQIDFFKHLLSLSFRFYHVEKTAELVSRMENDAKNSVTTICDIIPTLITELVRLGFFILITVNASPFLLLIVLSAGAIQTGMAQLVVKPIRKFVRRGLNLTAELRGMVTEILGNIRIVKAFGAEKHEIERVHRKQKEVNRNIFRNTALQGSVKPLNTGASNFAVAIIVCGASYEYFVSGRLATADTVLMFSYIAGQFFGPVQSLINAYLAIHQMYENSNQVYRISSIEPDVLPGPLGTPSLKKNFSFRNVKFSYGSAPVIRDLTLEIPRGKTTAIVGPSGAGKSTLIDLILRFYDPDDGDILMDGVNIREYKTSAYRRLFGVVTQETFLFNSTVRDNICYGREVVQTSKIKEAIHVANAEDFILGQANGDFDKAMNAIVGDRGIKFSGGQRQRLSIARAILSSPEILILDEATSSLDSESELEVQRAIEEVTRGLTAIIIAHRLSTILRADQIVVLEEGRIVGLGRHEDLLVQCELYKRLVNLQFGSLASPSFTN